jgi:diguanylate cyclase (GGDEF)-like protein
MKPSILVVDDNPAMIQLMASVLAQTGRVRFAMTGRDALAQMRDDLPDLVLLDAEMPGMNGFELCAILRADARLAEVPVIFVTAHDSDEYELRGLEAGAVDFISKPISRPLLLARVRTHLRLKALSDELKRLASIDGLTKIANRRCFEQEFEREWLRARRTGAPLSLLLVDVDHFKLYNDRYGHPAGDECLRAVAAALDGVAVRPADLVARYGGEEFVLLLPDTPAVGADHVAVRALEAVAALHLAHAAAPERDEVAISIGVACLSGSIPTSTRDADGGVDRMGLLRAADDALYSAKRGGRAQAWRCDVSRTDDVNVARSIACVAQQQVTA